MESFAEDPHNPLHLLTLLTPLADWLLLLVVVEKPVLDTRNSELSNELWLLMLRADMLFCKLLDPMPPKEVLRRAHASSELELLNNLDLFRPLLLTAEAFLLGGAVTETRSEILDGDLLLSSLARIRISLPPSQEVSVVKRGKGVDEESRYTLMLSTSTPRLSHTLAMASLKQVPLVAGINSSGSLSPSKHSKLTVKNSELDTFPAVDSFLLLWYPLEIRFGPADSHRKGGTCRRSLVLLL